MNIKFERDLILNAMAEKVYQDELISLKGMRIAIDATLLLSKAKAFANP